MHVPFLAINNIGFPGLGLEFNIDPVAIQIGSLSIYWYGIIIIAAIVAAYFYSLKEAKRIGFDTETISDVLLVALPSAIVCARLYYVAFSWINYASNPIDIIKIWEGGLAIYGGVIGAVASVIIYCRITKKSFWDIADIAMPAVLLGQAIGRWGNFVNCEAYGSQTSLPWRMQIWETPETLINVHPTFLYESLWNLSGFLILFALRKHKPFKGFMLWGYMLWYGLGRFFIEGLRTDSLMLGNARVSQIVSLLSVIVAIIIIVVKWNRNSDSGDIDEIIKKSLEDKNTTEETAERAVFEPENKEELEEGE